MLHDLVSTESVFHYLGAETEKALSENFDQSTGCLRVTAADDLKDLLELGTSINVLGIQYLMCG